VIYVVLLAAGASSRMRGGDKLLELVDGTPLLRRQAKAALSVAPTVVTLPLDKPERTQALDGLDVTQIPVVDSGLGMGLSIAAGISALPDACDAAVILPGDMPDIDSADLTTIVRAYQANPGVMRGTTADGKPGHPVVFPRSFFDRITELTGDEGARCILRSLDVQLVPLPGQSAVTDLDTPEDWDKWRASRTT